MNTEPFSPNGAAEAALPEGKHAGCGLTGEEQVFRNAALASYPLAWYYTRFVLCGGKAFAGAAVPVFTALYLTAVLTFARCCGMAANRGKRSPLPADTVFWAVCCLLQGLALGIYGQHGDDFGIWQVLLWHLSLIFCTLLCTGMTAEGKTGSLLPLDMAEGIFVLPWQNFFLRAASAFRRPAKKPEGGAADKRRTTIISVLLSLVAAAIVSLFAWEELSAVSERFSSLGNGFIRVLRSAFRAEDLRAWLPYIILSLPVGAWLFGLAGGGLKRRCPPHPAEKVREQLCRLQFLPGIACRIVTGCLCAVYALFFAVQFTEFGGWLADGLPDPQLIRSARVVSDFAISGFWQLFRILCLNFCILLFFLLFGNRPLRQKGAERALMTALFCFGAAFAVLAWAKLGTYIILYDLTPRRILAGWFLSILLCWCVLTVIRLHRSFSAPRAGILTAALTFSLLCCLPVERLCA